MAFIFGTFKYCTWNPRKVIPASKVWNPISRRLFLPRYLKNPKSAKLNSYEKFPATQKIVSEFVFRAVWLRLYPDFNNHAFGNCVNFSGKKVHRPHFPQVRKCPYAYAFTTWIVDIRVQIKRKRYKWKTSTVILHCHLMQFYFLSTGREPIMWPANS